MSRIKKFFGMITGKKDKETKPVPRVGTGTTHCLFKREDTTITPLPVFSSIIKVTTYDEGTLFLTQEKQVFVLGKNNRKQLGVKQENVSTPTKLDLENVIDVGTNEGKTLFIVEGNKLYGCGSNGYNALGLDDTTMDTSIVEIPSTRYENEKLLFVAPAFSFSILITDKSLFILGQNWMDPNDSATSLSIKYSIANVLENDQKIIYAQCGSFHLGALTNTGRAYTGGDTASYKLCRGEQDTKDLGLALVPSDHFFTSMHIAGDYTLLGTRSGSVLVCGYFARVEYQTLTEVTSFNCPVRHLSGDFNATLIAVSEFNKITEIEFDRDGKKETRVDFSPQTRYNVCTAALCRYNMFICLMDKHVNISLHFTKLINAQRNNLFTDITIIN